MDTDSLTPEERFEFCGVHEPKVNVVQRPDYTIMYEQVGKQTFAHVLVKGSWGLDLRRRMNADFDAALRLHGGPVFAYCKNSKSHLRKLAVHLGFSHLLDFTDNDGEEAEILIKRAPEKEEQETCATSSRAGPGLPHSPPPRT